MTEDVSKLDSIARFTLANEQIRGEIITLNESFSQGVQHQNLPAEARQLLAEFMTASVLLAEVLKFEGTLTLQVRGDGLIPLIMAEATHRHTVRGVAKLAEAAVPHHLKDQNFNQLVGAGVLTLTIDPDQGKRYQGIVPLEGERLEDCLNYYFTQSEQLPTRLWLRADEFCGGGLFLQSLPALAQSSSVGVDTDLSSNSSSWSTALELASTVKTEELTGLNHATVLYRLFHELEVTLFPANAVAFFCACTRERSANALNALGKEDALALLEQQKVISINCHFCGELYQFNKRDLDHIFGVGQGFH